MIVFRVGVLPKHEGRKEPADRCPLGWFIFALIFFYHTRVLENMAETGNNMNNPAYELPDTPSAAGTPYISDGKMKYTESY